MTQKEVIEQLKDSVSKLFWEKGLKVENDYGPYFFRLKDTLATILAMDHVTGFITCVESRYLITLDSAKAHLRLHEQDWQRSNPEFVREMEWVTSPPLFEGEPDEYILSYAGCHVEILETIPSTQVRGYFESGNESIQFSGSSIEDCKDQGIEMIIQHLKK